MTHFVKCAVICYCAPFTGQSNDRDGEGTRVEDGREFDDSIELLQRVIKSNYAHNGGSLFRSAAANYYSSV